MFKFKILTKPWKFHFILLEIFGIVQANTALENKSIVGMRNVRLQYLSIINPIIREPEADPNLPIIIEKQIAIALKNKSQKLNRKKNFEVTNLIFVGYSSTVEAFTTLAQSPTMIIMMYKYDNNCGTLMKINRNAIAPQGIVAVKIITSFPALFIVRDIK